MYFNKSFAVFKKKTYSIFRPQFLCQLRRINLPKYSEISNNLTSIREECFSYIKKRIKEETLPGFDIKEIKR